MQRFDADSSVITCPRRDVPGIDAGPDELRRREAFASSARHYLRMRSEEKIASARWTLVADRLPPEAQTDRLLRQILGHVQERLYAAEERLIALAFRLRDDGLPAHAAHFPNVADESPWRGVGVVVAGQVVQVAPDRDGDPQVVVVDLHDLIGLPTAGDTWIGLAG